MKRITPVVSAVHSCPRAMQRRWQTLGRCLAEPNPQPSPALLGTTLPSDFPVIINPYLGVPVLAFGASGLVSRQPRPCSRHLFAWK